MRQWVVTGNDPGASGGATIALPVTLSEAPYFVVANPETLVGDLALYVNAAGNATTVWADASKADYTYAYRILVIGKA